MVLVVGAILSMKNLETKRKLHIIEIKSHSKKWTYSPLNMHTPYKVHEWIIGNGQLIIDFNICPIHKLKKIMKTKCQGMKPKGGMKRALHHVNRQPTLNFLDRPPNYQQIYDTDTNHYFSSTNNYLDCFRPTSKRWFWK